MSLTSSSTLKDPLTQYLETHPIDDLLYSSSEEEDSRNSETVNRKGLSCICQTSDNPALSQHTNHHNHKKHNLCNCYLSQQKKINKLQRQLKTAAELGQALLSRHQSYVSQTESLKAVMIYEISQLQAKLTQIDAENIRVLNDNSQLTKQLDLVSESLYLSESKVESLSKSVQEEQNRILRINNFRARSDALEQQIILLEDVREALQHENLQVTKDKKLAEARWHKTERMLEQLTLQYENLEKEAMLDKPIPLNMKARKSIVQTLLHEAQDDKLDAATLLSELELELQNPKQNTPQVELNKDANGGDALKGLLKNILSENTILESTTNNLQHELESSRADAAMLKQQLAFVTQMLSMNTPLPASLSYTATSSSNDFLPTSIHEMAPDTTSTPRPDGSHRRTVFPRRNPSYQTPVKHKGPAGYSASNTETSLITHPESSHSKEMASALNHVEVNSFSEEVLNLPKLRRRHSLPDDKDNEVVNNDLTTASTKDAVILCDNMERNEGHDESKYYDNYLLQDVERGFVRKFISHESGLRSNRFVHHGSRFPLRTKHMSKEDSSIYSSESSDFECDTSLSPETNGNLSLAEEISRIRDLGYLPYTPPCPGSPSPIPTSDLIKLPQNLHHLRTHVINSNEHTLASHGNHAKNINMSAIHSPSMHRTFSQDSSIFSADNALPQLLTPSSMSVSSATTLSHGPSHIDLHLPSVIKSQQGISQIAAVSAIATFSGLGEFKDSSISSQSFSSSPSGSFLAKSNSKMLLSAAVANSRRVSSLDSGTISKFGSFFQANDSKPADAGPKRSISMSASSSQAIQNKWTQLFNKWKGQVTFLSSDDTTDDSDSSTSPKQVDETSNEDIAPLEEDGTENTKASISNPDLPVDGYSSTTDTTSADESFQSLVTSYSSASPLPIPIVSQGLGSQPSISTATATVVPESFSGTTNASYFTDDTKKVLRTYASLSDLQKDKTCESSSRRKSSIINTFTPSARQPIRTVPSVPVSFPSSFNSLSSSTPSSLTGNGARIGKNKVLTPYNYNPANGDRRYSSSVMDDEHVEELKKFRKSLPANLNVGSGSKSVTFLIPSTAVSSASNTPFPLSVSPEL